MTAYYRDILTHIAAVPGVQHSAAIDGATALRRRLWHAVHARRRADLRGSVATSRDWLRHGYSGLLPTLRHSAHSPVARFTDQDTASTVKVAMVNQDFVNKFLKGKDPLRNASRRGSSFPA